MTKLQTYIEKKVGKPYLPVEFAHVPHVPESWMVYIQHERYGNEELVFNNPSKPSNL